MGKVNLGITGGDGPYTITIREVNEISGNRYTGLNPTNALSNLDVNFIKDGLTHLYSVQVSNDVCGNDTETFEKLCPCDIIPSFVASQVCTNAVDPKIAVTSSTSDGSFVRIRIYNPSNVVIHDVVSAPGTLNFSVTNNLTYRISVSSGSEGLENCKATDQYINVACQTECTLSVTVSNPVC